MNNINLVDAIKAAKIHKNVGNYIRELIKPGISLKDIAYLIENKIKDEIQFDINNPIEKSIGFPVGLSLNNCAAHYTPNYNEKDIILKESDVLKVDYGVQIKGTIIDSAFTVHFDPKFDELIEISKKTTDYAISLCKVDAILGEIGEKIEEYVKSKEIIIDGKIYPLRTMGDLSGHKISLYEIHAGKALPNRKIYYPMRINEFEYYAVEPFITTGLGKSILKSPKSHFMLKKDRNIDLLNKKEKNLYDTIYSNYYTLPFCQKWLHQLNNLNHNYEFLLEALENKKIIDSYPPIYDIENAIVSQFEHTIFIKENGIINLTKNNFY